MSHTCSNDCPICPALELETREVSRRDIPTILQALGELAYYYWQGVEQPDDEDTRERLKELWLRALGGQPPRAEDAGAYGIAGDPERWCIEGAVYWANSEQGGAQS